MLYKKVLLLLLPTSVYTGTSWLWDRYLFLADTRYKDLRLCVSHLKDTSGGGHGG